MTVSPFSLCTNKKRIFEPGSFKKLTEEISFYGRNTAIFTGSSSLKKSGNLEILHENCKKAGLNAIFYKVSSEPSPELIDKFTEKLRSEDIDCVAGIGGGSVMDTAKAVSAMLCEKGSVTDYLEGVGNKKPSGAKKPLILVPTTAGTGSEASYNAVISSISKNGFKKSLRHLNYTAETTIIDSNLYENCPLETAASGGMDALSQLIESYISTKANFYTDILVIGAIEAVLEALPIVTAGKNNDEFCNANCEQAWEKMAYGAYISGLSLANSGLAVVHGIAGPVGGYFNAPHGAVCGTLLAEGMKATISKLEKEKPDSPALLKFSKIGYIAAKSDDMLPKEARARLIQVLEGLIENLKIPSLSKYGITEKDVLRIAQASSNKNNPVALSEEEICSIIQNRI